MRNTRSIVAAVALACIALAPEAAASWWTPKIRDKKTEAAPASDTAKAEATPQTTAEAQPASPPQQQPAQAQTQTPPKQAPAPQTTAPAPASPAPAAAAAVPAAAVPVAAVAAAPAAPPVLPDATLKKISSKLREGPFGREANSIAYLDLIDAGKASPAQVNDFATYLAKRGLIRIAIEYQAYATKLGPNEPTLWLNYGTMQRTAGHLSGAESAFKKAIEINPNHALAHYNLGAVYDAQKQYDDAIEEYRRALVLDPELADPRKNPQIVNNENLLAVKLKIYENQSGSLGLPLLQMQKPAVDAKAVPPEKK